MSTSITVNCLHCKQEIGVQCKPGDGARIFREHLTDVHPEIELQGESK